MSYLIIGLLAFLFGYVLCFYFFRKDIQEAKPIVFTSGVYIAVKQKM